MNTKITSLLIGGFLNLITLSGQSVLTKDDAIKLVLQNNFDIQIQNNQTKVDENNAGVLNSGYLPTLTANSSYNFSDNTNEDQGKGTPVIESTQQATSFNNQVSVSYTVFDGLNREFTYNRLQEQYKLSRLQARALTETTLINLFRVYYQVAKFTLDVSNTKESIQISFDRLNRAKTQLEFGQATKLDVLNAEVDLNNDSVSLINLRLNLENAKRDLNLMLARDLDTSFEVDTSVNIHSDYVLENLLTKAEKENAMYLQAKQNVAINQYNARSAWSQFLPRVNFSAGYSLSHLENEGNAQGALPSEFTRDATGINWGFQMSWNLFSGSSANNIRNRKLMLKSSEIQKEKQKFQLTRDVKNAYTTFQNQSYILKVQTKNLETANRNFIRSKERYQLGQINSLAFRTAQLAVLRAKTSFYDAKFSLKNTSLLLNQLKGDLLDTTF